MISFRGELTQIAIGLIEQIGFVMPCGDPFASATAISIISKRFTHSAKVGRFISLSSIVCIERLLFHQCVIGFLDCSKLFCVCLTTFSIGVILQDEFSVRLLYLGFISICWHD